MSVIAGVSLPVKKKMPYALSYIKGIGIFSGFEICKALNIDCEKRLFEISELDLAKIRDYIDKNYIIETDLRRQESENIKKLIAMRSYRGLRHQRHLPCRGQRTHSNANTRRKIGK